MPRRNRNTFLQQLERSRQEAAATAPTEKPISEMSEAELDAEEARLRGALRQMKEQEVLAAQQQEAAGNRLAFPKPKKRPPWK
jgi:hypothetical protein